MSKLEKREGHGGEGRGGKGRCFMLLDVSNKRNLVVSLEDCFWMYDTVFQMKNYDLLEHISVWVF